MTMIRGRMARSAPRRRAGVARSLTFFVGSSETRDGRVGIACKACSTFGACCQTGQTHQPLPMDISSPVLNDGSLHIWHRPLSASLHSFLYASPYSSLHASLHSSLYPLLHILLYALLKACCIQLVDIMTQMSTPAPSSPSLHPHLTTLTR